MRLNNMTLDDTNLQLDIDILKEMKDALEVKLDMYNKDYVLTTKSRETNIKNLKRKLNFINKIL